MNHQGVFKIIDLLNSLSRVESTETRYLIYVSVGCLMNLTDTIEKVQEQAIAGGAISLLLKYLEKYYEDEEIATNCLLVLNCLSVCENGKSELMGKSSLSSLMNGLEKPLSSDLMDSLLDLLEYLAENDPAKINMAELGMGDIMLQVIEKCHQNHWKDESQHILKLACDLIILILTGDTSMSILYEEGNGNVYQKTKCWLNSDDDVMQIAGALAAGNFARKDSYCIHMVEDHISESLLCLLEKHSKDNDIRLLHAVLSALRNLAIPAQNKIVLAQQGAIEKLLPLISVEAYPIIFKLLGILRMLIDKQEKAAVILGENKEFVQKVIEWCKSDDHPGVKGESTRTIAWLVKNSLNQSVMKNIAEAGGLSYLIEMIGSKYPVMQNEAIVSLTLIASTVLNSCKDAFDMEKIVHVLCQCLSSEVAPEVVQNILTFISILASSDLKEELLKWSDIKSSIQLVSENSNEDISKQAKNILQILES
ncbi:rap1 GTPase-GDP dissociation stimulator 1-like [Centruroides sculpturatus]|uniref:rap1 GTPase-GDP dissociation stimulator 1-like n=1 Tax=Centruroides sculpturatus TaxID=218467 RepID=UPI000C6EE9B7|nr:rap1 GTPase-GDP dissociation stimulator 1-like [Centruroides sculpturatus]